MIFFVSSLGNVLQLCFGVLLRFSSIDCTEGGSEGRVWRGSESGVLVEGRELGWGVKGRE